MLTQQQYLAAMGIQVWLPHIPHPRPLPIADAMERGEEQSAVAKEQLWRDKQEVAELTWEQLQNQITNCTLCDLHKTRTNTVFGVGNHSADLLIIGEAPGATEDAKGEPFVGRAGMLLDSMLAAIGLHRSDIFIANILKCRPPNNRDPSPREVELCTPYLQQQINFIKPKLIVAVGRIAAHFLLNTNEALGKMRGRMFKYGEHKVPLMVTYHPAYLLRSPREKSKVYEDMVRVKSIVTPPPTPPQRVGEGRKNVKSIVIKTS